ncbi:MAG: fasciclin domain-containing protein [Parasphingorhabdus sp.]|uniref:fasciclin domain-containing protein n=1 Tax=Parasphingorhabdus sp. TaxID=2709688 RepID=UPI003298B15B
MRIYSKVLLASVATIALAACSETTPSDATGGEDIAEAVPAEPTTIVGVAQDNADFSTLLTAVTVAELGETLSGEGPFTVFAPTNDAFGKVDATALSDLLSPEKKDDLSALLNYHVVAGKLTAADVVQAISDGGGSTTLKTVQGGALKASLEGEKVVLEDAAGGKSIVTTTDVEATNGVIHAIDTVVMPG